MAMIPLAAATNVSLTKEHHPSPSSYQVSGTDGYYPGDVVLQHGHLNVTATTTLAPLAITNLTFVDQLAPHTHYVTGSASNSSFFTDFGNGTIMWNFGSAVFQTPEPYTATVIYNISIDSNCPDNIFLTNTLQAHYNEVITGASSNPSTTDTIYVSHPILNATIGQPAKVENGSSFSYTITAANTGHADANGVNVTISLPSGVIYTPGTATATLGSLVVDNTSTLVWNGNLANVTNVGNNFVTITIPVTAATSSSGVIINANITAAPSIATVGPAVSCSVTVIHPAISLTKVANATKVESGSSVLYTFTAKNTGDTTLTGVTVNDSPFGAVTLNSTTLSPGAVAVGTLIETLTATTIDNATVLGTDQNGTTVSAQASAVVKVIHPAISLTKTPNFSKVENNTLVTYTYNTTNTGDTPLTASLNDNVLGQIFTGLVLNPGQSNITTVSVKLTSTTTNTATATGVDQNGTSVSATAFASVTVIHPAITLTKAVNATLVANDSAVLYTYTTKNTGDTPLTISLTDNKYGTIFTGLVLTPGATNVTTITEIITANVTNIATATGVDQNGTQVTALANATVTVQAQKTPNVITIIYSCTTCGCGDSCSSSCGTGCGGSNCFPVTTVHIGDVLKDKVVVTGSGGVPLTGVVDFFLDYPNGTEVMITTTTLGANGTAWSASVKISDPGSYFFQAFYQGDGTYMPLNSSVEPFSVLCTPKVVTCIQGSQSCGCGDNSGSWSGDSGSGDCGYCPVTTVHVGDTLMDKVVVTGCCNGYTPTGTVQFWLHYPNGTLINFDTKQLDQNGAACSKSIKLNATGNYYFLVTYSGDGFFSAANSTQEKFAVTQPCQPFCNR